MVRIFADHIMEVQQEPQDEASQEATMSQLGFAPFDEEEDHDELWDEYTKLIASSQWSEPVTSPPSKSSAGLSPDEFRRRSDAGVLRHVGLGESLHLIASRLGLEVVDWDESLEPVIASRDADKCRRTG